MFPARSPRIRHRNELTERDWENAVQGLGKSSQLFDLRAPSSTDVPVLLLNQPKIVPNIGDKTAKCQLGA